MATNNPDTERRDPLLRVEHLTTVFDEPGGSVRAVNDVSFVVHRGETLALVGESGSGKSATALSIMRLVQPPGRLVSGSVTLDGADLFRLAEREMQAIRGARMSLIFQEPAAALNPVFSVGDQLAEVMVVHGCAARREARSRAIGLLDAVRIPDPRRIAHAYPHQLSGGMCQRVMIAMALACRPALVIADEPTTALDVTIQAEILDLLREMKREYGISLVLITHDLGVVAETADRVLVMYAGRIVEQAPVPAIFAAPAHPYTKGLLASAVRGTAGRRLPGIDGSVPNLASLPPGCAFAPRCAVRIAPCATDLPDLSLLEPGRAARCHLHSPAVSGEASDALSGHPTSAVGPRAPDEERSAS